MPSWNVKLEARGQVVRVIKIINKKSDFMIVRLSNGRQQKLCDANFPEWRETKVGKEIELTIRESVTGARFRPEKFQKNVQDFLNDLQKRVSGLFFMWFCEHCKTMGYVTYEDGEEPQGIAERINLAHRKEIKLGCDKTKLKIYDQRGMPQRDSALVLSSMK